MDPITRFNLTNNEREQRLRSAELLSRQLAREMAEAQRKASENWGRFSIVRAVHCLTQEGGGGLQTGFEAEVAQETARQAGIPYDRNRPPLPWSVLMGQRTMTVAVGTQAGYLVDGTGVPTIADALAPWSITMKAGITVLSGLKGDVRIPRETATGTGQWLPDEVTAGTAANMTFAASALKPKNGIGLMEISGSLLKQGPLAEALIARSLSRCAAALTDQAVIAGTSTDSSVPLGVRYQTGVTNVTGTGLTYANILNEQEQVALSNVQDGAHAWIGHPTVRELLGARAVGTSAGIAPFLWENDRILNRPAYATVDVGTGRIVHGDWSNVVLGVWGPGFVLEHNPYQNFQADVHAFRIVIPCDVGVMQPGAMRVLNGIT